MTMSAEAGSVISCPSASSSFRSGGNRASVPVMAKRIMHHSYPKSYSSVCALVDLCPGLR